MAGRGRAAHYMVFSRSAVCSDGGGFPDLEVFEENAHVRFLRIIWHISEQRIFRERSTCVCCARLQSIADKRLKVIRRDRTSCTKTVVALSKQTICATLFLIGSILLLSSLRRVGAKSADVRRCALVADHGGVALDCNAISTFTFCKM